MSSAATHFSIVPSTTTPPAGSALNITVTALNASNSVVTSYSGTVHFASTDNQGVLPANSILPNGMGMFSVTLKTAGAQTVTATDTVTAISGTSGSINVSSGAVTHLSVSAPTSTVAGGAFNFVVTALDASNNVVTSYPGMVHLSSSDGQAALPGNSPLTSGAGTFSATLKTTGNQTVTATDTLTPSITGTSSSINVSTPEALAITSGAPPEGRVGDGYAGSRKVCRGIFCTFIDGFAVTVSGGVSPFMWSWAAAAGSSLPPGLEISNAGLIGGLPATSGTYNVVVTVTDSESPAVHVNANYTITIAASSADATDSENADKHHHYKLIDLGTLGGPNSYQPFGYVADFLTERSLSAGGTFAGWADTSAADPYAPNCFFDCFVDHAFKWKHGVRTDLGALAGAPGLSSAVTWMSPNGLISGISENGEIDPLFDLPVFHGVVWHNGKIIDLKTFEGGYESWANAVNDYGQVVGFASNAIDDPNSLQGLVTQTRAFLWQNGKMKDLGTLGGSDAEALFINERGQIVGQSYTADSIPPPNAHCTDTPLTLHAFFWEKGKMVDLSTLGGSCAFAYALNNQGQVVGQATLAGDQGDHPYIWEHGKMKDLGTLGGTYGYGSWLNDDGAVVGAAANEGDQALLAFRWKHDVMTNLGTLAGDTCSVSDAINSSGQVVGGSGVFEAASFPACTDLAEHAFLWEHGRMVDLNSFVPDSSDLTLNEAVFINDSGEISGFGTFPNGDQHAVLLIPCDENHPDVESCDYSLVEAATADATNRARVSKAAAASRINLSAAEVMLPHCSLLGNHRPRFPRMSSR